MKNDIYSFYLKELKTNSSISENKKRDVVTNMPLNLLGISSNLVFYTLNLTEQKYEYINKEVTFFGELTERENELVSLLLKGLTRKEISEKVHLSVHTVNTHCKNIYLKLGINKKSELFSMF